MYSIYADGTCIYNDLSVLDECKLIDPTLTMEDNAAGSLEMTLPPANVGYSLVKHMSTEIVVKKNDKEIWSGRVSSEEKDFYNQRSLYCEGELAYLNDSTQPQAEYHDITVRQFLETLLNVHNSKVGKDKQFKVGIVTVTDSNDSLYRYTNYEKTIECINDKLIDRLGGHLRIRKDDNGVRYLDYLKDYPCTNTQVINFGENLLDFTQSYDLTELATVILPLGAMLEESKIAALESYLDVSSVNDGSVYVKSDAAVKMYGWIEKVVRWDDVTQASNLLSKAKEYLADIQFEEMELNIKAVDLNYFNANTESIKLLDEVRVVSKPHGLDRLFPVTKIMIPLNKLEDTEFTMGTSVRQTLTEAYNSANSEILNRIEEIPTPSSILQSAKDNASELIKNATNGYVTIISKEGETQEILMTNIPDYTKADKVWRWNINGFGYSSTGYGGSYALAMTMDGAIVADRITVGTMHADRIKGGTLTLGGVDNSNGIFLVKDGSGDLVCQIDNTGAVIRGDIFSFSDSGNWLSLSSGSITGGFGDEEYGVFDATAFGYDINYSPAKEMRGFRIKTDYFDIRCPHLATIDSTDDVTSIWTVQHDEIPYVQSITDNGDGSISWTFGTIGVINGLITHY